jgi:hypothetical protein
MEYVFRSILEVVRGISSGLSGLRLVVVFMFAFGMIGGAGMGFLRRHFPELFRLAKFKEASVEDYMHWIE